MGIVKPRILLLTEDELKKEAFAHKLHEALDQPGLDYVFDHASTPDEAEVKIEKREFHFLFIDFRFGLSRQENMTEPSEYIADLHRRMEDQFTPEDNVGVCYIEFDDYGGAERYLLDFVTVGPNKMGRKIALSENAPPEQTIHRNVTDPDFIKTNWDLDILYDDIRGGLDHTILESVEDILRQLFTDLNSGEIVVQALDKQGFSNAFLLSVNGEAAGRSKRDVIKIDRPDEIKKEQEQIEKLKQTEVNLPLLDKPPARSRISPLAGFRMEEVAHPIQLSELLAYRPIILDGSVLPRAEKTLKNAIDELKKLHAKKFSVRDEYQFAEQFEHDYRELNAYEPHFHRISKYFAADDRLTTNDDRAVLSFDYLDRKYVLNDPTHLSAKIRSNPTTTTRFSYTHGDLHAKNILASHPSAEDTDIERVFLIDVTELDIRATILDYASLEANLVLEFIEKDEGKVSAEAALETLEDFYQNLNAPLFAAPIVRNIDSSHYINVILPKLLKLIRTDAKDMLVRSYEDDSAVPSEFKLGQKYALALLHMYLRQTRWIAQDLDREEADESHVRQYKDRTALATLLICSALVDLVRNSPDPETPEIRTKYQKLSDGEGSAA